MLSLLEKFAVENCSMTDFGLPEPESMISELDRENLRYDKTREAAQLFQLQQSSPNTPEMDELFVQLTDAIASDNITSIVCVHGKYILNCCILLLFTLVISGEAGTGKTTFAQKILAYTRSLGKIALGCASTNLAAQVYVGDSFTTAHDLFGIPVVEDAEDFDSLNEV